MSVSESINDRNFSTFHLGDDPGKLAGGLIYKVADGMGIKLGSEVNPDAYGKLVGALGPSKVLRENEPNIIWDVASAAQLVEDSGIQQPLDRSLWMPDIETPNSAPRLATGAVANWQDRTIEKVLTKHVGAGELWLPTGTREMGSPTERTNANVAAFNLTEKRNPTEVEYAAHYVVPKALKAGFTGIHIEKYVSRDEKGDEKVASGDEIANDFAVTHPELFDQRGQLAVARVANAGVQLAMQFRKAVRTQLPASRFDADKDSPQLFILTDTLPVATNEEQLRDPKHFQSPYTALRQTALTAKLLAEAHLEQKS